MWHFPGGSVVKNPPANVGDMGSIPGSGRYSGGGNGNSFQYSCLENPMDRESWQAKAHGVTRAGHDYLSTHMPYNIHLLIYLTYCPLYLVCQLHEGSHCLFFIDSSFFKSQRLPDITCLFILFLTTLCDLQSFPRVRTHVCSGSVGS